jgi:hypothetical protein
VATVLLPRDQCDLLTVKDSRRSLYNFTEKRECQMATLPAQSLQPRNWKDLYVAALMEGDKDRASFLIQDAERAIVDRARLLFQADGDNMLEQESLDDALYALHALKGCLAAHGRFAEAA